MNISMNKNMFFDYLYVDDFARIVEIFLAKNPSKRSYNVGAEKSIDFMTIATLLYAVGTRDARRQKGSAFCTA